MSSLAVQPPVTTPLHFPATDDCDPVPNQVPKAMDVTVLEAAERARVASLEAAERDRAAVTEAAERKHAAALEMAANERAAALEAAAHEHAAALEAAARERARRVHAPAPAWIESARAHRVPHRPVHRP